MKIRLAFRWPVKLFALLTALSVEVAVAHPATQTRDLNLPMPKAGRTVRFAYRPGVPMARATLKFLDGEKKPQEWSVRSFDEVCNRKKDGKREKAVVEDAGIAVSGGRNGPDCRLFSKPRLLDRYEDKQVNEMLDHPEKHGEPARSHVFAFEFRRGDKGLELWEGGSFVAPFPTGRIDGVRFSAPAEAKVVRLPDGKLNADPLKLDLEVPKPFDTSVCKVNLGSFLLECDGYLSREPHDAMPDSFLRRVPAATYSGARVHCRLDGAATNSCKVTARLSNYHCPAAEGRSPEASTSETKELPHQDGEYDLDFVFDPGRIQDLIHDHRDGFLDFELLGGVDVGGATWHPDCYKPDGCRSGVTILGVTLLKSPASLHVANGADGNVFVQGETPHVTATVAALKPGGYRLAWRVKDLEGTVCERGDRRLSLGKGEKAEIPIAFKERDVGWYRLEAILADDRGQRLVKFPDGAFTVIAPDDRKAGYESPYFTWNRYIKWSDTNGFRREGTLLKKLGIRRTQLGKYTEEDAKEFGLTLGEAYWFGARGATQAEKEANCEKTIREMMEKWPHLSSALIYHEANGGPQPLELTGGVTELTAEQLAHQTNLVNEAVWRARIWRKVAPQVELKLGNSGSSLAIMGSLFRGGYPKDLIDTMGEEDIGEVLSPERAVGEGFRNLKDLAELYGYATRPSACFEWKTRVRRGFFGDLRKQAAWYTRDAIIALAWGSRQVTVESEAEIGNSYFNTCWGGGAFTRDPLKQPFPLVSATANMTRTLDRCSFSRLVPTGSKTAYVVEFRNPEGRYVSAAWLARGEVEAKFESEASSVCVRDLFGRERRCEPAARFAVRISEEPTFLLTDKPIAAVDATGARTYPREVHPGQEKRVILAPLDRASDFEFAADQGSYFSSRKDAPQWFVPGSFDVGEKRDDGRTCLAVTLRKDSAVKPPMYEGGLLRLKEPITVPEEAKTIGIEVRGNSTWGKVLFEIVDANGHKSVSLGYGSVYYDMSDMMSFNYDGWHLLQIMIRPDSPAKIASIGMNMKQWRWWSSQKPFAYPLKITGIGFVMRRWTFDLLNWVEPDTDTVLFRNLCAY